MENLSIETKIEMAVKMVIFDAIEHAEENKNDSFELKKFKVHAFLKTATFQKMVDQYLEIINNTNFNN